MPEHATDATHEYRDFVLIPDDEPGVIARIGRALGEAEINIEAISAFTGKGKGIVHILVRDPEAAQSALDRAGFDVRASRPVLVLDTEDTPGVLGEAAGRLADAGINIEQAYVASHNRVVFAVDDIDEARRIFLG